MSETTILIAALAFGLLAYVRIASHSRGFSVLIVLLLAAGHRVQAAAVRAACRFAGGAWLCGRRSRKDMKKGIGASAWLKDIAYASG